MSDKDTIAALQRNLAAAEVERIRLVAELESAAYGVRYWTEQAQHEANEAAQARAEVERLKAERDALCAEVEAMRRELNYVMRVLNGDRSFPLVSTAMHAQRVLEELEAERDEARAEVERLSRMLRVSIEQAHAGATEIAERQREACAAAVDLPEYSHLRRDAAIAAVRATPLVTEEKP